MHGVIKMSYKPRALCRAHKVTQGMPWAVRATRQGQAVACEECYALGRAVIGGRLTYISRGGRLPLFDERGAEIERAEAVSELMLGMGRGVLLWDGKASLPPAVRPADAAARLWGVRVLGTISAVAHLSPLVAVGAIHQDTDNTHLHLILSGQAAPPAGADEDGAPWDMRVPRSAFALLQQRVAALCPRMGVVALAVPDPLGWLDRLAWAGARALAPGAPAQAAALHTALLAGLALGAALLALLALICLLALWGWLRRPAPAQPYLEEHEALEPGSAHWASPADLAIYGLEPAVEADDA